MEGTRSAGDGRLPEATRQARANVTPSIADEYTLLSRERRNACGRHATPATTPRCVHAHCADLVLVHYVFPYAPVQPCIR